VDAAAELPEEPLSSRVADLTPAEIEEERMHINGKKKLMRKGRRKTRRRRHRRESETSFDEAMSELSPLSARVADEDLYDLFIDYFEKGGLKLRRKR